MEVNIMELNTTGSPKNGLNISTSSSPTPPPPVAIGGGRSRSSRSNTPSQHTGTTSRSSRTSSTSELERECEYLSLNRSAESPTNGTNGTDKAAAAAAPATSNGGSADNVSQKSGTTAASSTNTALTSSTGGGIGTGSDKSQASSNGAQSAGSATTIGSNGTMKKRVSSSRTTPAMRARRIRFYRNGDRFYAGIVLAVSAERYRSFESLVEDLTRLMEERISGAVRNIYTTAGKKITSLDDIEDGLECVCLCNKELFKKLDYTAHPNKQTNRLSRHIRAGSPHINGGSGAIGATNGGASGASNGSSGSPNTTNQSPHTNGTNDAARCVHPRIVTLIRNGTKPRRVLRLLLNKRNSPSFDHVLTAITQCVKLDSGCVRKVFTCGGLAVQQLADFFGTEAVFFAYGTERVQPDDFRLEPDEQRAVAELTRRGLARNGGGGGGGPKPRMPVKNSVNLHNKTYDAAETEAVLALLEGGGAGLPDADATASSCGASVAGDGDGGSVLGGFGGGALIDAGDLPERIRSDYVMGPIVGDGNFAVVLRCVERRTGVPYALKIIDKSKCKGKEHYIDAEVRVMKKLRHPHIMELMFDVDTAANMFLVLEYVSGGDLFDAITSATRFTESQARIMMRHLASAMAYLHALGIVHRDIKPENLLVELDADGQVVELKLADFGLACEVVQPLLAVCGTPTYVAPEILLETGYGLKIDVWAAGIILYILLCGFPPFVSPDNQQEPLFDAILSGVYEFPEPYWTGIGDDVRDLIANMLQSDPDLRFSSEDVLDHIWTIGGGGGDEGEGGSSAGGSLVDFS